MIDLTHTLGGGGFAVSSLDLASATEERIALIQADAETNGGIGAVCELTASLLNVEGTAITRRIYEMRHRKSRSMNAEVAEAFTQALGGWRLDDLDIPTIPRSIHAAQESVDAFFEDLGPLDRRLLAHKLHRFAAGYIATFEDVDRHIEADAWREYEKMYGPQEAETQDAVAELVAA